MKRALIIIYAATFLVAANFSAAPSDGALSRLLVGRWSKNCHQVEYRADGASRANSTEAAHAYGNWHISDGKLIQIDWSGHAQRSTIVWDIVSLDGDTLKLRYIESNVGAAKRYDSISTFRRIISPGPKPPSV